MSYPACSLGAINPLSTLLRNSGKAIVNAMLGLGNDVNPVEQEYRLVGWSGDAHGAAL